MKRRKLLPPPECIGHIWWRDGAVVGDMTWRCYRCGRVKP